MYLFMFIGMVLLALSVTLTGAANQARALKLPDEAAELLRDAILSAIVGFIFLYASVPTKVDYKPPTFSAEVAY
jgi:hypothetical protein